ncbi:hypothetical protein BV379_00760 [Rhodovulum sulfidophilum]|nr:hypothetical protein BV379_00760 [Rhodovulum sulfidophilum]
MISWSVSPVLRIGVMSFSSGKEASSLFTTSEHVAKWSGQAATWGAICQDIPWMHSRQGRGIRLDVLRLMTFRFRRQPSSWVAAPLGGVTVIP